MVRKALALLVGVAVLSVALGVFGLFRPGLVDAQTPSASRTIMPATVAPGGEVVVTIALSGSGFSDRIVNEVLPEGFRYKPNSVMPSGIRATPEFQENNPDVQEVFFTITSTTITEFSYTVIAPNQADDYMFSGMFRYVDPANNDERSPWTTVAGDTAVTVEADAEPTDDSGDGVDMMEPEGPAPGAIGASRMIAPSTVAPGGEAVVTINTMGFTVGLVKETLEAGFSYKENSVNPSTIRVTVEDQDIYFTTVAGVRQFSYTVIAPMTDGGYSFSGELSYVDEDDVRQTGVMVTGDTEITVGVAGPTASRTIMPATVGPGDEVVVTIATSGFMVGLVKEELPAGFMYKENSVSPSTIRVTVEDQDVYFTTVAGVRRFSYTVIAPATVDDYSFSGELSYLDEDDERQTGLMVTGATQVMVASVEPSASRTITPMKVVPGGEVVIGISTRGFTVGLVQEMLPEGFTYKENSVDPDSIRVTVEDQDIYFTTVAGVRQFDYTAIAPMREDNYSFSGELSYVDQDEERQTGVMVTGDTRVRVQAPATATPTPEPTRRKPSRRGGGGGGGGGYAPVLVTATPMPTRVPSIVATIVPTPTPIIVPTIIAPTAAPTPEPKPTARPEPTAVPTAMPKPTAVVVVPTVEPTKPPEPTAMPKPTAVPPTAVPPTEVPPTAMIEPTEPPAPTATIAPTVAPVTPVTPEEGGMPTWLIILVIVIIVAVVIAAVGFYMMRMRR